MNSKEFITLNTYNNRTEANIASSLLGAYGIDSVIESGDHGGMFPQMPLSSGVKLLVEKGQFDEAKALLSQESEVKESFSTPMFKKDSGIRKSLLTLIVGITIGFFIGNLVFTYRNQQIDFSDRNSDGQNDVAYTYYGDFLKNINVDMNFDGKYDSFTVYTKPFTGEAKSDTNFDGEIDLWSKIENDQEYQSQYDSDFNGIPDCTNYLKNGQYVSTEWHPNGSKTIIKKDIYKNGVLSEETIDNNGDGKFDTIIYYDSFGFTKKTINMNQ